MRPSNDVVVATVRANPDKSYTEIAEMLGMNKGSVSGICQRAGYRRRADPDRIRSLEAMRRRPQGEVREGGIVADDAQWKARQCRIGGC